MTWRMMPRSSTVLFMAGVFCLFATMALIGGSMSFEHESGWEMAVVALFAGGMAILWAFAGTRKIIWLFFVLAAGQWGGGVLLGMIFGSGRSLASDSAELAHQLHRNGIVEILLLVTGYLLLTIFFNREGARFFRTQTEVRLAGEIHRALVPAKHERIGKIELFGSSTPSGEVGGDLFDIVQTNGSWHAYVADVSGHGVAAGILMSMIKSTAAMQLTKLNRPNELLRDLNDVLQPYTSPANYSTFAYVGGNGEEQLHFALAGHLPILHYQRRTGAIAEHTDDNLPIGMFKGQSFQMSRLALEPGDLLAIITDGFTEVFDAKEQEEIGLGEFKRMLLERCALPLEEMYAALRAQTMRFGKQSDDQTMLLIRKIAD